MMALHRIAGVLPVESAWMDEQQYPYLAHEPTGLSLFALPGILERPAINDMVRIPVKRGSPSHNLIEITGAAHEADIVTALQPFFMLAAALDMAKPIIVPFNDRTLLGIHNPSQRYTLHCKEEFETLDFPEVPAFSLILAAARACLAQTLIAPAEGC